MKKRILISAGEPSGDMHAANLVKELKAAGGDFEFFGIGCEKLAKEGVRLIQRMDKHAIVGLWEVFANLAFIRNLFKAFRYEIKTDPVDLAILVDYPGFNLALAKILKKKNVPVIYYISPQIWAWGMWRINDIRKYVDKMIVILPFEEELYKKHGVDASYIGHPIMDTLSPIADTKDAKVSLGIAPDSYTIGLLPGSRVLEAKKILPVMIGAAKLIREKKDAQFIVSKAPALDMQLYNELLSGFDCKLVEGDIYTVIAASDFIITASGTVTVQIAIAQKPMIITYITSPFTYWIGRLVVKLTYIGLVNVILGKKGIPEILQFEATARNIANKTLKLLSSEKELGEIKERLAFIKNALGAPGASKKAAHIICDFLKYR